MLASLAVGTVAVSCVLLAKLVLSAVPSRLTVEPLTKLVPITVIVVSGAPVWMALGLMEATEGTRE
jgi:hypothetical protein